MLTKVSIHDFLGSSQQVVDADLRRYDDLPSADVSIVRSAGINYEKQGKTIDLSFWRAPDRLFDEPDELLAWARLALAAARRVAATRKRSTPRARTPSPRR